MFFILSTVWFSPARANFGHTQVIDLLNQNQPDSVEEFLGLLPLEFRSNFILMHHTQSQDQVSLESPRIILFNDDATLLMAVSGSKHNPRGKFVEMIHFDSIKRKFTPSEIEFEKNLSTATKFKIDTNPKACYGCHGQSSFHPIWRSYDRWPGAFGGAHAAGIPTRTRERLDYWRFKWMLSRGEKQRYRLLGDLPFDVGTLARRNSQFTSLLAMNNVERVAQLVIDDLSRKPQYLGAMLAALLEDKKAFEALLSIQDLNSGQELIDLNSEMKSVLRKNFLATRSLLVEQNGIGGAAPFIHNDFELLDFQELVMVKFLEGRCLSHSINSWTTTKNDKGLEFSVAAGSFFKDLALTIFNLTSSSYDIERQLWEAGQTNLLEKLKNRNLTIRPAPRLLDAFRNIEGRQRNRCNDSLLNTVD